MAFAGMTIQGMVHLLERLVSYVFYDPSFVERNVPKIPF